MELPKLYDKLNSINKRKVREQYIQNQKGLCYWCENPLDQSPTTPVLKKKLNLKSFPPGFLDNPVHLQHCHETGLTEGAVHAYCNGVMWQYHNK